MVEIVSIDSLEQPALAPYRTMRRQQAQRDQGIFIAEGEKVVRRLLASELTVHHLLMPPEPAQALRRELAGGSRNLTIYSAPKALLEQLTGFSMYQGWLALASVPAPLTLTEILGKVPGTCLLCAADGLTSAENMGALVRNAAGLGAHALLTSENCASPYLRRAVRNSMGTLFNLPIIEGANLPNLLQELRRLSIRCFAAHAHCDEHALPDTDLRKACCIVLGSEGYGISSEVLKVCDETARIPMREGIDSLNVASAAAIFLYEANRQRRAVRP